MKIGIEEIKVCLITDDKRSRGRSVEQIVQAAVNGGVRCVQYRPWKPPDRHFLDKARALRKITRAAGSLLIINDRPDIAALSQADGVHLGSTDISIEDARRLLGEDAVVGYSAHTHEEVTTASRNLATYITYSPVFPTTSTSVPRKTKGVADLVDATLLVHTPVFALGGVNEANAFELLVEGIQHIAVVSAVTESDDPEASARNLCNMFNQK